jgi:hypothetical protein
LVQTKKMEKEIKYTSKERQAYESEVKTAKFKTDVNERNYRLLENNNLSKRRNEAKARYNEINNRIEYKKLRNNILVICGAFSASLLALIFPSFGPFIISAIGAVLLIKFVPIIYNKMY